MQLKDDVSDDNEHVHHSCNVRGCCFCVGKLKSLKECSTSSRQPVSAIVSPSHHVWDVSCFLFNEVFGLSQKHLSAKQELMPDALRCNSE